MPTPKTHNAYDSLIELLNHMLDTQATLSEFDKARLKRDASRLNKPNSYACLAAISSFIGDVSETLQMAEAALKYRDLSIVDNVFHALYNLRLYGDICTYAIDEPWVLQHPKVLLAVYQSALYSINLEVCDMTREHLIDHDNSLSILFKKHDIIKNFLSSSNYQHVLREYITYALQFFHSEINTNNNCVIEFEEMHDEGIKFLAVDITLTNINMDQAIDLESTWHKYISNFNANVEIKSLISFQIEGDSFND